MARKFRKYRNTKQSPDISRYKNLTSEQLAAEALQYVEILHESKERQSLLKAAQVKLQSTSERLALEINKEISLDGRSNNHETISTINSFVGLISGCAGTYFLLLQFPKFFELLNFVAFMLSFIICSAVGSLLVRFLLPKSMNYNDLRAIVERNSTEVQKLKAQENKLLKEIERIEAKIRKDTVTFAARQELASIKYAQKKARDRERSAKIAAIDGKARQGSQSLKKELLEDVKTKSKECPYCEQRISRSELVMDHIHPIAKGGQTVPQNSILICQPCNSLKRALTLRAFCKKADFDYEDVAVRLERQGKWV